jgi:hypothetical protein
MRGNRLDLATADELWDHYIAPARTDSSAVARAEALRRIVGAPGVSNHRWQVRAMGARRVVAGPSRTCAARYVVTDQATGARASHLLVALDDGSGRLQGAELTDAAGDLSVVAARAARRGLMAVADAVAATFELVDLAPDDRSEILAAHVDVLSQRGMSGLDIEAGIAMIGQLTDLGLDVPPALAGTVAGSLANRLRALLDRPVVDETAAIRLLGHGATVAWVSDGELAGVIDAVIDRSVRGLGGVPPPAAALRRLAVLARLAARSGPPAPSIWWVQNAVVGWRSALAPSTRPEVRSALGELAVAIDVAWPDALPLRNRFPST